jgi:plastocyanin
MSQVIHLPVSVTGARESGSAKGDSLVSKRSVKGFVFHVALAGVVAALSGAALYSSGLQTVRLEDRCDPETFNAALGDGTCVGDRNTTFDEFNAEFAATGSVDHWSFKEDEFHVRKGESVNSFNIGGEAHTFTPVAQFGGGFVPPLNAFAGPTVPECALPGVLATLVPAGGESDPIVLDTKGVQRFQCCIHPWMQSVVTVRKK